MGRRLAPLLALLFAAPALHAEQLVDGIAAQVGSEIVLVSEVMRMSAPVEAELLARGASEADLARVRAEALERLIDWRLMQRVVREADLGAGDEEIESAIAGIAEQNQISVEELRRSLVSHGMSFEEYREQIKREIEQRKVMSAMLGSKVRIEEEEVQRIYAERFAGQPEGGTNLRLRQILVPFGEEGLPTQSAACDAVRAARQRVAAGEDFGQVASQVSAIAPERGGDIGWVHWDTAASWMRQVVEGLEPGQTSDLITLPSACTLLQLVERRDYEPVSYEQARPVLERELEERQMADALSEWLDTMRAHTYIQRRGLFAEAASLSGSTFPVEPEAPEEAAEPLLP